MVKIDVTAEVLPATGEKRPLQQVGWAYLKNRDGTDQPHPQRVLIPIWQKDGQKPYAAGQYTLAPASIFLDRYSSFALAPKLVPLPAGRGGA